MFYIPPVFLQYIENCEVEKMKLGIYHIPDLDPEKAVEYAKIIYDFPEHRLSRQGFAEKLGIKRKSGWFGQILASLIKFGLAKVKGDETRTTELTEKLLNPKPNTNELKEAKWTIFNSIKLWEILYTKGIGKESAEKEDFWVLLSEIEGIKGLDRKTVIKKTPSIQKRYIWALSYIGNADIERKPVKPLLSPPKASGLSRGEIIAQPETTTKTELLKIQYGDFYIQAKKEDAKDTLLFVAKKLGIKLIDKKTN